MKNGKESGKTYQEKLQKVANQNGKEVCGQQVDTWDAGVQTYFFLRNQFFCPQLPRGRLLAPTLQSLGMNVIRLGVMSRAGLPWTAPVRLSS